jgi:hypothetical protein
MLHLWHMFARFRDRVQATCGDTELVKLITQAENTIPEAPRGHRPKTVLAGG